MKQKLFAWGDDFTIRDADGRDVFLVDGKAFSFGDQLSFRDLAGNELAAIRQKLLSWGPTYEIYRNGSLAWPTNGGNAGFEDTSAAPGSTVTYTVRAVDEAGNASPFSNPASSPIPSGTANATGSTFHAGAPGSNRWSAAAEPSAASAIIEPTEMSIPLVIMTMVTPTAMIA